MPRMPGPPATALAFHPILLHSHPNEEVWHFIEGKFEVTIAGKTQVTGPGTAAVIPVQHEAGAMLFYSKQAHGSSPLRLTVWISRDIPKDLVPTKHFRFRRD